MTQEKAVQELMAFFRVDNTLKEYLEVKVSEWMGEAKNVRTSDLEAIKEYIRQDI